MKNINLIKIIHEGDSFRVKNIKNFYNMLIIDYDFIPGKNNKKAINNFICDELAKHRINKSLLKEILNFRCISYIRMIEDGVDVKEIISKSVPKSLIDTIKESFDYVDGVSVNEFIIKRALYQLLNYHPLTTITHALLDDILRKGILDYKNDQKTDKSKLELIKTIYDQINFARATTDEAHKEKEYQIYKLMHNVDESITKGMLLEEFVRGDICRNVKLVDLFYDLYKDDYEYEYNIPLYHGLSPKYISDRYDIDLTFEQYSGHISFSKSKEIAVSFANRGIEQGVVFETIGTVKGLDIEKIINDYNLTDQTIHLKNCKYEEEVLIRKMPEKYKIHDLKNYPVRDGLNRFNSVNINVANQAMNNKHYNAIVLDLLSKFDIFVNDICFIRYHSIYNDITSIDMLLNLIRNNNTLYIIDDPIEDIVSKELIDSGFVGIQSVYKDIPLGNYIIHESQLNLIKISNK